MAQFTQIETGLVVIMFAALAALEWVRQDFRVGAFWIHRQGEIARGRISKDNPRDAL